MSYAGRVNAFLTLRDGRREGKNRAFTLTENSTSRCRSLTCVVLPTRRRRLAALSCVSGTAYGSRCAFYVVSRRNSTAVSHAFLNQFITISRSSEVSREFSSTSTKFFCRRSRHYFLLTESKHRQFRTTKHFSFYSFFIHCSNKSSFFQVLLYSG